MLLVRVCGDIWRRQVKLWKKVHSLKFNSNINHPGREPGGGGAAGKIKILKNTTEKLISFHGGLRRFFSAVIFTYLIKIQNFIKVLSFFRGEKKFPACSVVSAR